MLDNGYVYLAESRLSLFRSPSDWAAVFEIFGYSPRAGIPDLFVTTIGSAIERSKSEADFVSIDAYHSYLKNNRFWEQSTFYPITSDDWMDSDNLELLSLAAPGICLRGKLVDAPSRNALASVGVKPVDDARIHTFEVARWLAGLYRNEVLATDAERTAHIPSGMSRLVILDDWNHPDVVLAECHPSTTDSFKSISQVLATGNVDGLIVGQGNTHWRNWPDGGML